VCVCVLLVGIANEKVMSMSTVVSSSLTGQRALQQQQQQQQRQLSDDRYNRISITEYPLVPSQILCLDHKATGKASNTTGSTGTAEQHVGIAIYKVMKVRL
jgi:hypothetical protein